jgi:hypothetical protein
MKKSLAKITFKPVEGSEDKFKVPTGPQWFSCTSGCSPNDWSIRIQYTSKLKNNVVQAEIDFLMPTADYLLKKGVTFNLFGGLGQFDAIVEVIEELSDSP